MSGAADRHVRVRTSSRSTSSAADEQTLTDEEIRRIRNKAMSPPKPLLIFAAVIVVMTISLAVAWRYWLNPGDADSGRAVVQTQSFRFVPDGSERLDVRLMPEDRSLTVVTGHLSSFLQGMVRSLDRQRMVAEVADKDAPFSITYWKDGRLTLDDPTTGTSIALQAYGLDNTAHVFTLLEQAEQARAGGDAGTAIGSGDGPGGDGSGGDGSGGDGPGGDGASSPATPNP